jgi:hypothetical protein
MKIALPLVIVALLVVSALFLTNKSQVKESDFSPSPSTTFTPSPTAVDFTASFEIYTLGAKRIFNSDKYHNLSSDVYITSQDPSMVIVKKGGIKWRDFFATLPMKLTKECLTTGTGQVFCTGTDNVLKFSINGVLNPNSLDELIGNGDKLIVTYE